jgi:hypothetical protein
LAISNYPTQFTMITSLTVSLGKPVAYFQLAAATTTPAGLYTLQFSKSGDTNSQYTNIPPLTVVVQNNQCTLTTDASTYTLPLGGNTLAITISGINCMPAGLINFGLGFTGTGNGQFSINSDLSVVTLSSSIQDGMVYFIVKHTIPASGSLIAGNSVTGTFTITGSSSAYYIVPASITLTLVDPTTFQTFPTGTALGTPTITANRARVQMQCSQASLLYWGIGVYPSILNYAQVDFQARIISGGNGLVTNFTEVNDHYGKVYGFRQGSTMQVVSQTLYNLQSNTNYIFKYYCVNQLGHVSDSQSINFTTLNYGAYLMKV